MAFDRYPLRRLEESRENPLSRKIWPATLPPVHQLLQDGLDLGPATVFVGENGSGKSTLIEAIAEAYGLSVEGGSTGAQHSTRASESGLSGHLQLIRNAGTTRRGYFLRAETMHGFFTYLEKNPSARGDAAFHDMSHGESFLELVVDRFRGAGLWVLDEPESALSFPAVLCWRECSNSCSRMGNRRCSCQPIRRFSLRCPGLGFLRWASGDCGNGNGRTWILCITGASS